MTTTTTVYHCHRLSTKIYMLVSPFTFLTLNFSIGIYHEVQSIPVERPALSAGPLGAT